MKEENLPKRLKKLKHNQIIQIFSGQREKRKYSEDYQNQTKAHYLMIIYSQFIEK